MPAYKQLKIRLPYAAVFRDKSLHSFVDSDQTNRAIQAYRNQAKEPSSHFNLQNREKNENFFKARLYAFY